jgi:N-acetylmuramoyl-L-alanine amidase
MKIIPFLLLLLSSFSGKSEDSLAIIIIKTPILYNADRSSLSLKYLKERHGLIQDRPTISPKIIVLHHTGGGTLKSNFNYFNQTRIEGAREMNKKQSELNVSAHYLIDRDGTIYQLMEDTLFARHIIGLNYCSIGIENIGSLEKPLTDQQVNSNAQLVRYLKKKYNIEYLIGHCEYGVFRKSPLWKETNQAYFTGKQDPEASFIQKVREKVRDLNLKSLPILK